MECREMTPVDPARNPIVVVKEGEVFASSHDVAAFFGKNHRDVMRSIDVLVEQEPNLRLRNFTQTLVVVPMPRGGTREDRCYDIDRDGFTLLAMGFTGTKALKFKLRYIEAFNNMEAELRRVSENGPALDLNDPNALRGLLLSYSEKALELEKQVDELRPSQEALQRISEADGSLCVTDSAKALQMRPKDLFSWLRQNGWIYRRPGTSYDLGYQSKVTSGLLEHKVTTVLRPDGTEKVTEQVRVTPKGLTKLASLIPPPFKLAS